MMREGLPGRSSRFVGLAITLTAVIAILVYFSRPSSRAEPDAPIAAGTIAPTRGGQIVASIRSEPRSFNRLVARDQTTDLISLLTQGRLVRINRATFDVEPWLAERWEADPEGRTWTLHLRQGVTWSDGVPFTAADVLFSVRAALDDKGGSVLADALRIGGAPLQAEAIDPQTVRLTFAAPSGPGLRPLDALPILPKHKLEAALDAGRFGAAWSTSAPPAEIVGTGPFVLRAYEPGQRLVFDRNPRYWRKSADGTSLPYLDRVVLEVVPDQNAELLRLRDGSIDLTSSELRPDDVGVVRQAERDGRLKGIELGVSTDADAFWFCLKPEAKRRDPRFAFVSNPVFRQALSHAVDREAFAQAVFLGEAVPIWGPVTPGNRRWFSPNLRRYPHDLDTARNLLRGIGLEDRDGNGIVEDARGAEARFTVITQRGVGWYERGARVLHDDLARVGVALDVVPLEFGAMIQRMLRCDYDAIYMRPLSMDLDPAGNLDMWLSSGSAHFWDLSRATPATDWEARIDALMRTQATTRDETTRVRLFTKAQDIFADALPVLYFAAPRLYYAYNPRVRGVVPSVQRPPVLWNVDELRVGGRTP